MEETENVGKVMQVMPPPSTSSPESHADEGLKLPKKDEYQCFCALTAPIQVEVIQCKKCKHFEHVPCRGYMSKANVPEAKTNFCVYCRVDNNLGWKDTLLKNRFPDARRRRMVCIARLYNICCDNAVPFLELLSEEEKAAATKFLTKNRLLRSDGSKPRETLYPKLFYDVKPSVENSQQQQ